MYLTERPTLARKGKPGVKQRVAGTVILMGIVSMFTDISSESVNAILPLYLTAVVGLGPLAYGFIDGIYQGVSALVRILGGWLADRGDHPKWIAFFGYALSAVTRIALIPAASFATISTVITIDRLGKGVRTAPRDAVITASSPPDSLGRAFGVHRALDTLGAVIGPLLAFAILQAVSGQSRTAEDFRPIFVISFAAAVIGLAILLLVVPDVRPRRQAAARTASAEPSATVVAEVLKDSASASSRPSLKLLADRRFALLITAAGILGILTVGDGFVYLALQRRDNLAIDYFPLLYVGTNLAYFVMAVPFGRIADRVGRSKMFLAGHVVLPVAYLLAGGPISGPVVVMICLLLLGTYYAATDGQLAALAGRIVDPAARTSGIATAQTVQAVARFVSSLAFGLSWTLFGARTALYLVAAVLAVVVAIAWVLLLRTNLKPDRPAIGSSGWNEVATS
ncbi:MAG: MFS transporter [Actinomycetota bacterium]|nr:MFS transporter [Actinomycetota bacterium]MDQ2957773.1 MFS transporter [Actinomycetota bacterium]